MKIRHRYAALLLFALTGTLLLAGCGKKHEKIDLSSTHTTAAAETMAPETDKETTAARTTAAEKTAESTTPAETKKAGASGSAQTVKKLATKVNTYTSGGITVEYPSVTNMEDSGKAAAIDELLKKNALSVIGARQADGSRDTLQVACKVVSADNKRITVTYTGTFTPAGAAYPTNLFYSNTVNVGKASDMGFSDFSDPASMAAYLLSGDCRFYNVSAETEAELQKAKTALTAEQYTELFKQADFPFTGNFPDTFSYEDEGTIFFSIPVTHALGDYAIVMYTPETK